MSRSKEEELLEKLVEMAVAALLAMPAEEREMRLRWIDKFNSHKQKYFVAGGGTTGRPANLYTIIPYVPPKNWWQALKQFVFD